jgi:hypothetical protein
MESLGDAGFGRMSEPVLLLGLSTDMDLSQTAARRKARVEFNDL